MFEFILASMGKGHYVGPPDAGPDSCSAFEAGGDREDLEANLRLTSWERIARHDKKLDELPEVEAFMAVLQRGWN